MICRVREGIAWTTCLRASGALTYARLEAENQEQWSRLFMLLPVTCGQAMGTGPEEIQLGEHAIWRILKSLGAFMLPQYRFRVSYSRQFYYAKIQNGGFFGSTDCSLSRTIRPRSQRKLGLGIRFIIVQRTLDIDAALNNRQGKEPPEYRGRPRSRSSLVPKTPLENTKRTRRRRTQAETRPHGTTTTGDRSLWGKLKKKGGARNYRKGFCQRDECS